jgi:cytochrome c oxidase subunit 2
VVPGLATLLLSCDDNAPSVLEPRGPGAERIEGLWWFMLWISVAVFLVVIGLIGMALRRARRADVDPRRNVRWGEPLIVFGGAIIPALILAGVFVVSLREMSALSSVADETRMTIDVVGHDWWWEVFYGDSGGVTANEIHIPVGEPVRLRLSTDDVIHSFWVPQLQAKLDMVPGTINEMWLEADAPGRYRGQCAEFCGLQHANMIFYVVAEPAPAFQAWLEDISRDAGQPVTRAAARGRSLFMDSTCVGCHAIRGTPAAADVGPDLTHLAERDTIASGVLPNTRANLALWITDPQEVKPGAAMPPTEFTDDELNDLLDYLQQLE